MNKHILREAVDAALYKEQRDELLAMVRTLLPHANRQADNCGLCKSDGYCSCGLDTDIYNATVLLVKIHD